METGCFSLLHEFLSCLYCLITWQGGFNSRPRPVYFGMGRISLWAELPGWVCALTPFISDELKSHLFLVNFSVLFSVKIE